MPIHYSGGTHIIKMQQLSLRKLIVVERVQFHVASSRRQVAKGLYIILSVNALTYRKV